MSITNFLLRWTLLMVGSLGVLTGCASNGGFAESHLQATNAPPQMSSNELAKANAIIAASMNEGARKDFEDRLRGVPPPPSEFPFPNVEGYAQHPPPNYVNFYAVDDRYPAYLQCQYDVNEKNYSHSDEPKWFKAALKQIRRAGPTKFPPIKWVAVIIYNRGDYKDEYTTFEQCTKVGAIFKASDVFGSAYDLSQLVTRADMDRHPLVYDTQQPTPGEQQRWVIVERHAATNNPTTVTTNSSARISP
jgi:hypothetical protein